MNPLGLQTNKLLRGIHNAWHFYYALILVIKVVCSGFGIALFTP
ncbi:DUF3265 domain-containing protein [Vibrio parahaemolyticus]|nr:DUF3265 domain-containing protein [Vibrio parahaemolyticus]